jgi:hypothetical protein
MKGHKRTEPLRSTCEAMPAQCDGGKGVRP